MQFARHLRESIKQGDITTSIRVWKNPRVRVGGRYRLEAGYVMIDELSEIEAPDNTPEMARESGFESIDELMKTAKHGQGENVYFIRFHYVEDDDYADLRDPGLDL